MPIYIITYDLNKEGESYNRAKGKVERAIKNIPGAHMSHCSLAHKIPSISSYPVQAHQTKLTTTWIVGTNHPDMRTVADIYAHVFSAMDPNDELLVGQLSYWTTTDNEKIRMNLK